MVLFTKVSLLMIMLMEKESTFPVIKRSLMTANSRKTPSMASASRFQREIIDTTDILSTIPSMERVK